MWEHPSPPSASLPCLSVFTKLVYCGQHLPASVYHLLLMNFKEIRTVKVSGSLTVGMMQSDMLDILVPMSIVSRQTGKETTARCGPFFSRSCSMWDIHFRMEQTQAIQTSMPALIPFIYSFHKQLLITLYPGFEGNRSEPNCLPLRAWSLHEKKEMMNSCSK